MKSSRIYDQIDSSRESQSCYPDYQQLVSSLEPHDKSFIVKLLFEELQKCWKLERANREVTRRLAEVHIQHNQLEHSYIRRVSMLEEAQQVNCQGNMLIHNLECQLDTFRRQCRQQPPQTDILWKQKYQQLNHYTDQYIRQTAELSHQFQRNMSLVRQEKAQLKAQIAEKEQEKHTLRKQLQQQRLMMHELREHLAQQRQLISQLQQQIEQQSREKHSFIKKYEELQFIKAKYEESTQISRELIARYQDLEKKCIALEQQKQQISAFAHNYQIKIEQLEAELLKDLNLRQKYQQQECQRLKEDIAKERVHHQNDQKRMLKQMQQVRRGLQDARKTNSQLIKEMAILQNNNMSFESRLSLVSQQRDFQYGKCLQISRKIQEFMGFSSIVSERQILKIKVDNSNTKHLKPTLKNQQSHKTMTTICSEAAWREEPKSLSSNS